MADELDNLENSEALADGDTSSESNLDDIENYEVSESIIPDDVSRELGELDEFAVPDFDLDQNIDVFSDEDPNADTTESSEQEENEEDSKPKEKSKPPLILVAVLGVLVFVLIAVLVIAINIIQYMNRQKAAHEASVVTVETLSKPADLPNNTNFLYVNDLRRLDSQDIILRKMIIDPIANVFHFAGNLDIRNYVFTLYDGLGRSHAVDLAHVFYRIVDDSGESSLNNETIVRFEPFSARTSNITLEIMDVFTREKVHFTYTLDGSVFDWPVKYYRGPVPVETNLMNIEATIDQAIFSSAGSIINYRIRLVDNPDAVINFGDGNTPTSIRMTENGRIIYPTRPEPLEFVFNDGEILGRMDFEAISNLNSTIQISFRDAFVNMKRNDLLSVNSLLNGDQVPIDIGNYTIMLEGLQRQGDFYVLVFHAIDKFAEYDSSSPTSNRVEVRLDAELIAVTEGGMEIVMDIRSANSGTIGNDTLFYVGSADSILSTYPISDIMLQINGVYVRMNDITVSLDLSEAHSAVPEDIGIILARIEDSFNTRLAHKSGTSSRIIGFSQDILSNESLMQNYELTETTQPATYSVQILSYAFEDEDNLTAVVQEFWRGIQGDREIHFHRTHQIRATKINDDWLIVENTITQ